MADFTQTGVELVVKGEKQFFSTLNKAGGAVAGFGKKAAKAAAAGIAAFGAGVAAVGAVSVKAAISFESAFAGVIKTTDGLVDAEGRLTESGKELRQGFRDLAKEVPTSVEELARIGELGGQLGIAKEDLIKFTSVIADMGEATSLTSEEAAVGFAQIASVMGTSTADIERMGSSVVALGNKFSVASEKDILNFAKRISGTANLVGITEDQLFAISTAFASVGITAEAGGTAVNKVFSLMNEAAVSGGEQMEIFAAVSGISAEHFGATWERDAGMAFQAFVNGLGVAGDDATAVLEALGLQDEQTKRAFLTLAGAGDRLNETMMESSVAWDENTALAKEAAQRYATTEAQFGILKNTIKDVAITIGDALLPFVNKLLQKAKPLIEEFGKKLPQAMEKLIIFLGSMADAFKWAFSGDAESTMERVWEALYFGLGVSDEVAIAVSDMAGAIVSWFKEKIPQAIQTLSNFWTGILQPAIQTVIGFIQSTVIPAIQSVVTWLQTNIPLAIQTVSNFFSGTLVPILQSVVTWFKTNIPLAIQAASDFFTGTLVPAFQTVVDWLQTNIPAAIQTVSDFFTGTLQPALSTMWSFIQANVIPIFEEVQTWLQTNIPLALEAASDVIQETIIPAIQDFIDAALEFIDEHGPALRNAFLAIGAVLAAAAIGSAILGIVAALGALLNPITLIVVAVGLLAAAWTENWGGIREKTKVVVDFLIKAFEFIKKIINEKVIPAAKALAKFFNDKILPVLKEVAEVAIEKFEEILDWVETNWPAIEEIILNAIDNIKSWIEIGLKVISDFWAVHGERIMATVTRIWETIKTVVEAAINVVKGVIAFVLAAIQGDWEGALEALKGIASNIWNAIKSVIGTIVDAIATVISVALDGIKAGWKIAWDKVEEVASTIWGAIKRTISTIIEAIKNKISTVMKFITETTWQQKWTIIKNKAKEIWEDIKLAVSKAIVAVSTKIAEITGNIATGWTTFLDGLKTHGDTIWDGIKEKVGTAIADVLSTMENISADIQAAWKTTWDEISLKVAEIWGTIKRLVNTSMDALIGIIDGFKDILVTAGKNIVAAIKEGIESEWGNLKNWFGDRLGDLTDLIPWSSPPRDPSSPLQLDRLESAGENIVLALLDGMQDAAPTLIDGAVAIADELSKKFEEALPPTQEQLDKFGESLDIFEMGKGFGGLGSAAAGRLKSEVIGPLEKETEKIVGFLEDRQEQLSKLREKKGVIGESLAQARLRLALLEQEMEDTFDPDLDPEKRQKMLEERQRLIAIIASNESKIPQIQKAINFLLEETVILEGQRAESITKTAREQERILKLQKAQQDLKFLEQQFKFVEMITDRGLDIGQILGGVQLGLEADLPSLVDAMTRAMNVMIRQAQEQLGISSPSQVFKNIGQQVMTGFASGIQSLSQLPSTIMSAATSQMVAAPAMAGGGSVTNNEFNMGGNTIQNGMDMNTFENRILRIVERGMTGR